MNQEKIGSFIASCRKEQGFTQAKLAEKLGITDRAVSKWENGKSLPDASIMLELCDLLKITVNELLSGERLDMNDYRRMAEENIIELRAYEEATNKRMLSLEVVVGYTSTVAFLVLVFAAAYAEMPAWARALLIGIGLVLFASGMYHCLRLEREVGYYECQDCGDCPYEPRRSLLWGRGTARCSTVVRPASRCRCSALWRSPASRCRCGALWRSPASRPGMGVSILVHFHPVYAGRSHYMHRCTLRTCDWYTSPSAARYGRDTLR